MTAEGIPVPAGLVIGPGEVFEGIMWLTPQPFLPPPIKQRGGNVVCLPMPVPQGRLYAITVQRAGDGPPVLDKVEELPGGIDPVVIRAALGVLS